VESRPTRVLLVDDHELFVESARAVLEADLRFDVVGVASNGSDAVELAGELEPDLVLMDIAMPGMDGVEATREIRQSCPGARVVMLTGRSDLSDQVGSGEAGAIGYLSKDELSSPHLADSLHALVELS
jgi:DNA-binding NarL/FixJ family response regulator